jgi:uncharacterized membrane protein YfcA
MVLILSLYLELYNALFLGAFRLKNKNMYSFLSGGAVASLGGFDNQIILFMSGIFAGFIIGIVAAMLGVAGGEFIIPTLILLFGLDPKLAGSVSLCISLPTMIMAFFRYSKSQQFQEIKKEKSFVTFMIIGSIVGSFIGSLLLQYVNSAYLAMILGIILLTSAFKVFNGKY